MNQYPVNIFQVIDNADVIPYFYNITKIKINALCAYNYLPGQAYKLTKQYRFMISKLYLDSGAYSVMRGKAKETASEYRRYIHRFGNQYDEYFGLDDDFGNPNHNFNNQVFLEKGLPEGFKRPIPVIHDSADPYGELESYAEQGYDYIAIGSDTTPPEDFFYKSRENYPGLNWHIFGKVVRKELIKYRPYSCDSAAYAHHAGFGNIFYWDQIDKREYRIYIGEMEKKDKKIIHYNTFHHKKELEEFLFNTFKFEHKDLLGNSYNKWVVNLYFFKQLEDYINSLPYPITQS